MLTRTSLALASLIALPALAEDPAPGYVSRVGNRAAIAVKRGGGDDTEAAVKAGLMWLARHQDRQLGCWHASGFGAVCPDAGCTGNGEPEYDAGVTGLALMAFAGAGYGPDSAETWTDPVTGRQFKPGDVVKAGAEWLEKNQGQDGCLGDRKGAKVMYGHAIATGAMCELYGLTRRPEFKNCAVKALDWLLASRNTEGGWRYTFKPGDNDTSVTGWCVHALRAAQEAGIEVEGTDRAMKGAMAWIELVTDREHAKVGYTAKGTGKVILLGKNDTWDGHETLTAIGMLTRLYAGEKANAAMVEGGAKLMMCDLPTSADTPKIDSYYWYWATLALFRGFDSGSKYVTNWNRQTKLAVLGIQKGADTGCAAGSWDAEVDRWAFEGGRISTTALNVMTLEVYYRWGKVDDR